METFGISDMSTDVFKVLSLFRPYDISIPTIRIGPPRDGGYVLAEMHDKSDVISFGISNDVRFEKAMAEQGHRCFMYDHTISGLPEDHPNFNFYKLGVSGSDDETPELLSIKSHLDRIDHSESMLLKIDVEGAEWDVFSTISPEELGKFEQISGEFHWLMELDNPAFSAKVFSAMKKLTDQFTLFHVHANNCRPLGFVAGFPVADVLELSFVRTDLIQRTPSARLFPDDIDKGNNHAIADHALLFYPFLPMAEPAAAVSSLVQRLDGEKLVY